MLRQTDCCIEHYRAEWSGLTQPIQTAHKSEFHGNIRTRLVASFWCEDMEVTHKLKVEEP